MAPLSPPVDCCGSRRRPLRALSFVRTLMCIGVAMALVPPALGDESAPGAAHDPPISDTKAAPVPPPSPEPGAAPSTAPDPDTPEPPPVTVTVTVEEALRAALSQPVIARRRELVDLRGASQLEIAERRRDPSVRALLRVTPLTDRDVTGLEDEQTGVSRDRLRASVSAGYTLYDGGRYRADRDEVLAEWRQDLGETSARKREVAESVIEAYYRVLRQGRSYEADRSRIAAAREVLRGARVRHGLGTVARIDVMAAQSELSEALADAERHVRDLGEARARLAVLIGEDPIRTVPGAVESAAAHLPADLDPASLADRALENNPERARLLAQREAARARIAGIRADRRPSVRAGAAAGVSVNNPASHDGTDPYVRVSVTATLPLFEGGVLRARERVQQANEEIAGLLLDRLERETREQILHLVAVIRRADLNEAAARDAVRESEERYRLAREGYGLGVYAQLEVLEAVTWIARARNRLALAQEERDVAAQRLALLTGDLDAAGPTLPSIAPGGSDPAAPGKASFSGEAVSSGAPDRADPVRPSPPADVTLPEIRR